MFPKTTCLILANLIFGLLFSQDVKKDQEKVKTKMDVFSSKTGGIVKFVDYNLPNLKSSYASADTRVRKITSDKLSGYFYQIEKKGQYSNTTASIEYTDLLEVIKALDALKSEVDKDKSLDPDYLENKFVTDDGFQIGYYVSKGKATWYLKLERYGSDNTLYLNDVDAIQSAFLAAKLKIEESRK
jgi:hypothetical protein